MMTYIAEVGSLTIDCRCGLRDEETVGVLILAVWVVQREVERGEVVW